MAAIIVVPGNCHVLAAPVARPATNAGVERGDAKDYKGDKFKGTIAQVGEGKVTLRDEDQKLTDFYVVAKTTFMREERPAKLDDLQRGDVAVITARREVGHFVALRVFVMPPE